MKATVDRAVFVKALKTVTPALPKHAGLPVLAGVHLAGDDGQLTLTCTSLDLTITTSVDAEADGAAIAPAGLLARVVSSMAGERCAVSADDTTITIESGDTLAELRPLPVTEWPKVAHDDGDRYEISADAWARINRIAPMASRDTARPKICTIFLSGRHASSTDSYRAGMVDLDDVDLPDALVPSAEMSVVLHATPGPVAVRISDRHIAFTADRTTWTSRLVPEDFPDISKFEHDGPHTLTFQRGDIEQALRRMTLFADEDRGGRMVIRRDGDKAQLECVDKELGAIHDVVSCAGDYEGEVRFNPRFVADLVAANIGNTITLRLKTERHPAVCRSDGVLQILMPVAK